MQRRRSNGFTLIEAMIAMLVVGFGLLAIAGFQATLSHNSDVAKQRTEATRLAQAKIEDLRSYQRPFAAPASAPAVVAWADIAGGADVPATTTNTLFNRSWDVSTDAASRQKTLRVSVGWSDRQGSAQSVTLATLIANADPMSAGALAAPPTSAQEKRPTWGMPPIPNVGKYLGGGKSAIQWTGGQYIVFSASTGMVLSKCSGTVDASTTLATVCSTPFNALLVTGFISGLPAAFDTPTQAAATGLTLVPAGGAAAAPDCQVTRVPSSGNFPRDPGTPPSATFSVGYYSYACLIQPLGGRWSGSLQVVPLAGSAMLSGDRICRLSWDQGDADSIAGSSNEEHPNPYVNVDSLLTAQNFVYVPLAAASICPPDGPVNGIAVSYNLVNTVP